MAPISEELVRKRAEHNEGQIGSLEELSLHQLDIERIENIDKWCPHLKILYLQGNLISKIENVKKLKNLSYLNLAMNNLICIENLSGCESLFKLDLTLNFIRKLSDIDRLNDNYNLRELYLTGNPCASYDGYRHFVIAKLPHLTVLDGRPIERSERIIALQNYDKIQIKITEQEEKEIEKVIKVEDLDGIRLETSPLKVEEDKFWTENTKHDPETRLKLHRHLQRVKGDSRESEESHEKSEVGRKLTGKDGRILNINEPKVDFQLMDDLDKIILDVSVYKYLETSLIDVDIEPNYVKIFIKKKLFQFVLSDEVKVDQSSVQRSLATGHLVLIMPKLLKVETLKSNLKALNENNHKSNCEIKTKFQPKMSVPAMVSKENDSLDLKYDTKNSTLKSDDEDESEIPELI